MFLNPGTTYFNERKGQYLFISLRVTKVTEKNLYYVV